MDYTSILQTLHTNTGFSAFVASIPILTLLYLLGIRRIPAHKAIPAVLVVTTLLAISYFQISFTEVLGSGVYGVLTAVFPIIWIVVAAVFLHRLTESSGHFTVIKDRISTISSDRRIQALLVAYCLGAFLEGATGFGAPVAITAGILVGLGFNPLTGAAICLIANTAPVAFGGIGIPILTAGSVSGVDPALISRVLALQLPILSLIVPVWLVVIIAGWKRAIEIWPALLVVGGDLRVLPFLMITLQ